MEQPVLGILVTHASLGTELLRTAETILGRQSRIEVISNTDTSVGGLSEELCRLISGQPEQPIFLFVDLLGGSCSHACQEIRRLHPNTIVFSGVNLPMFLEFLYHRDRVDLEELRTRVVAKGRDGIQCLP
jgi:mannose/fructose-specific phosphotransferase system component IIA